MGKDVRERWVEVGGLRVHLLVAGEANAPPVLMLHGGGYDSASLSYGKSVGPLSRDNRVFAPDWPGYGRSDKPKIGYGTGYYVDFLGRLMDALGLERASLVGISMGGAISVGFALRSPRRVERLVLVDSHGLGGEVPWRAASYALVRLPLLNKAVWAALRRSRGMVERSLRTLFYDPRLVTRGLVDEVQRAAKDPKREGEAPTPEDFVGVAVTEALARDIESSLLGSMSPPLYPLVNVTKDDFEHPETGERRRFVVVGVRRSSRLHQVTADGDLRFYRRAGYQNRRMDRDEVRLRLAAEATIEAETDEVLEAEAARIERVSEGGPRAAFVAVPTVPHRFAVEPATGDALREFAMYVRRQPPRYAPSGVEILSPGFDGSKAFVPAGDGARNFYRIVAGASITAEVRVRRDGFISSARNQVEMYTEPDELLWLRRPNAWDEVLVPDPEVKGGSVDPMNESLRRAAEGYPSLVVDPTPAVRLDPSRLLAAAKGFLRFVREVHAFLGYLGPVRVEVQVSGGGSYLATPQKGPRPRFYFVSEQTELRASLEAEHQDLGSREAKIAEEILARLAWHFGLETFQP